MQEYRPCIVTENTYKFTQGDRINSLLSSKTEKILHNAVFHFWREEVRHYESQCPVNRYSQPISATQLIAVVEYEDGTIHEHSPYEIQFTDGMVEKFRKNKKSGWNVLTESKDSYPKTNEHVLFKTKDGRIFYGICGADLDWSIDIEEGIIKRILDVVEWREIQL